MNRRSHVKTAIKKSCVKINDRLLVTKETAGGVDIVCVTPHSVKSVGDGGKPSVLTYNVGDVYQKKDVVLIPKYWLVKE